MNYTISVNKQNFKMNHSFESHFIETNDIKMHYRDSKNGDSPILFLHGLTANAHAFDGLIEEGIAEKNRLIIPDMRGRGESERPAFGYSIADHAEDILGLLDHVQLDKISIAGHSFGGLLGLYMAANYPDRIEKLCILDAAAQMNPRTPEMLAFAVGRLDKKYESFAEYINEVKQAPYMDKWDDVMLSYYRADVMKTEEGGVTPRSNLANIIAISMGVAQIPWEEIIEKVAQKSILMNGLDAYTLGEPLLPDYKAMETVEKMQNCTYLATDGNHQTMLYGNGAKQIVRGLKDFMME